MRKNYSRSWMKSSDNFPNTAPRAQLFPAFDCLWHIYHCSSSSKSIDYRRYKHHCYQLCQRSVKIYIFMRNYINVK